MPRPPLSLELRMKIQGLFPPEALASAIALLEDECGTGLPLIAAEDDPRIERIRCAVVRLSEGRLEGLRAAIAAAKTDWRDVLVAAGFAHDPLAHLAWREGAGGFRWLNQHQATTRRLSRQGCRLAAPSLTIA